MVISRREKSMKQLLSIVQDDHRNGSKSVARNFLTACRAHLKESRHSINEYKLLFGRVKNLRPSMVILFNTCLQLEKLCLEEDCDTDAIDLNISTLLAELDRADELITKQLISLAVTLPLKSILVHSYSSTVASVIRQLAAKQIIESVICTESRPQLEGVTFANDLSRVTKTMVVVDTMADVVMQDCDGILIGADAVDKSGNILNKIGSRMIALSARNHTIPVICLAERLKIHPSLSAWEIPIEMNRPDELGFTTEPGVSVLNQYFEVVERDLLTHCIFDN